MPTEIQPSGYAPSPARPRRTAWIFLGLLVFLACSSGILGYLLAGGPPKKTVDSASTPQTSVSSRAAITVVAPARLGNRLKNNDPQLNSELNKDMASLQANGAAVHGIYRVSATWW